MKISNTYSRGGVPQPYLTPKKKAAANAQARVYGTAGEGNTSKVSDYQAGMEAEASCFNINLK